jgi:hypothetical protein
LSKLFFLLLCGLFIQNSIAQSPGGISVNNKMWLRSDNGVITSGSTVTQWQEFSGANVTGNFNVQPLAGTANVQTGPTLIPAGVNFNPYLSFDGVTNSLSSINSFLGTALVSNSNVTVFQVLNLKSGIVWLKWETDQLGTTARLGFENAAGKLRFDFPKAVPASAGQNIGVTNILNKHSLSTTYVNVNTSVNRLNGADENTIPIPGPGNFAAANIRCGRFSEYVHPSPTQILCRREEAGSGRLLAPSDERVLDQEYYLGGLLTGLQTKGTVFHLLPLFAFCWSANMPASLVV